MNFWFFCLFLIRMTIDIRSEIKHIVLRTKKLQQTYSKKHNNSKYSLDMVIDEILYFFKSGVSWRLLRSPINYKTLYWHYKGFIKNDIFKKVYSRIRTKYLKIIKKTNKVTVLIDSTIIYNKYGINKIGRNKFYKNKKVTKLSLMTDINGFPLSILFMKGNYHDVRVFHKHVRDAFVLLPNNDLKVIADKGYATKKNYSLLDSNNVEHVIPPRKNMKIYDSYKYSSTEYKKRIKIEQIFGRLKFNKRLCCRYEKLLRSYSNFVYLALLTTSINIIKVIKNN